jgi:fucose permease
MLAGLFLSLWKTGLPALWIGGLLSSLATIGFLILRTPSSPHQKEPPQTISFHSMILWSLSFFLFIYVGIETGLGGWLPTYMQKTEMLSPGTSALFASEFWLALALGRLIIAFIGSRFSSLRVLAMSLTCSLIGSIMLILGSNHMAWTLVGVFFTGLGFGPLYPTTVAVITTRFRPNSGGAVGLAATLGSLGGMVIPYLQGLMMQEQSPSAAASLPLAGLLIMGAVFTAVLRRS